MRVEDNITWCTKNEHEAMCQSVYRLYEGERRTCDEPAEYFLGKTLYVEGGPLGYCDYHWRIMRRSIRDAINTSSDNEWLMKELMDRGKALYWAALGKEQRRRRRINEKTRKQLIENGMARGSHVYFIQCGDAGPIKIGVTQNVDSRFAMLQTSTPYQLHLRAVQPGDANVERAYHAVFEEHRIAGEWFTPVPKLLKTIKAVRERHGVGAVTEDVDAAAV